MSTGLERALRVARATLSGGGAGATSDASKYPQSPLSLSSGRVGQGFLYTALARASGDSAWFDAAEEAFADAVGSLPTAEGGLYAGVGGFALAVSRFHAATGSGRRLRDALTDAVAEFGKQIFGERSFSWVSYFSKYELISGMAGFHLVAIELELDELIDLSRRYLQWYASYPALHAVTVADRDSAVNFGMSHGLPGMLAALAIGDRDAACAAEAVALGRAIAAAAYRPDGLPRWPYWFAGAGEEFRPARSAWCYGNPGVAAALAVAGERYDASDLIETARDALAAVIALPRADWELADEAVCHGTAGVALCFDAVARIAGDQRLAAYARALFDEVDARFDPALPYGYRAKSRGVEYDDVSLLTGTTGIALAYLSTDPEFDRTALAIFGLR